MEELSAERVLREIARLAFSDHRKLFNKDGSPKPLHELDDDTAAALASVESVSRAARGAEPPSQLHKVKLGDKLPALVQLGRYFKLFADRPEADADLAESLAAAHARVKADDRS